MKKVLLLGDSIRLSYQPVVKAKLDGLAEVVGPEDNCRFAKYALWYIKPWLSEYGKIDIIHWNIGRWDTYHHDGEISPFTPLDEYMLQMKKLLKILKSTGAKIIWATTTPVNPRNNHHDNKEIDSYNAAMNGYITEEQIEINDLNKIVKGNIESYIGPDELHLSDEGREVCSEAIVQAIKKYL